MDFVQWFELDIPGNKPHQTYLPVKKIMLLSVISVFFFFVCRWLFAVDYVPLPKVAFSIQVLAPIMLFLAAEVSEIQISCMKHSNCQLDYEWKPEDKLISLLCLVSEISPDMCCYWRKKVHNI